MEIKHKNSIKINSEQIDLNNFVIDEPHLVKFFLKLQDENNYTQVQLSDKIIYLLKIGRMADKSIKIGDEVEYVEKSFTILKQDIENQIKNNFSESMKDKIELFLGPDGSFVKELQGIFGMDGEHSKKINDLICNSKEQFNSILDRNNEDSPFKILEKSINEKLNEIKTSLDKQEGYKKGKSKSTQKGFDFENFVEPILIESSQLLDCNFVRTSKTKGIASKGNTGKGDFVLTDKKTNKTIVLEAKKMSTDPTIKDVLEYSRSSIENRAADYCVYIYCDVDDTTIPPAGMFNEIAKNILFVTVSDTDSYEAKERMIRLGCSWALARIRSDISKNENLNERLKELESRLSKDLDRIKTMKINSTSVVTSCSEMISELKDDLGLKPEKESKKS